jgi:hypothetical protein
MENRDTELLISHSGQGLRIEVKFQYTRKFGGGGRTKMAEAVPPILPLELVDKCIGSKVWVIMKNDKGMYENRLVICV